MVMLHPSQPTPRPNTILVHCAECGEPEEIEVSVSRRFICETCMPRFACRECGCIEIHYNMRTWKLCDDCATIPRVLLAWVRQLIGREW